MSRQTPPEVSLIYNAADTMIEELLIDSIAYIDERFNVRLEELSHLLRLIYESFYEKREKIQALIDVRKDRFYLWDDYRSLLIDKYKQYISISPQDLTEKEIDYQSQIYASIVMTSVKWLLESGEEGDVKIIVDRLHLTLKAMNIPELN